MKTRNLLALLAIGVFIAVLAVSFADNVSIYTDFAAARKQAAVNTADVHVVAQWVRREEAQYDPSTDCFRFYLQDSTGSQQLVHYYDPKPANFEQADKVVVIGKYDAQRQAFVAEKMLMKCPSKYQNDKLTPAKHYEENPQDKKPKEVNG